MTTSPGRMPWRYMPRAFSTPRHPAVPLGVQGRAGARRWCRRTCGCASAHAAHPRPTPPGSRRRGGAPRRSGGCRRRCRWGRRSRSSTRRRSRGSKPGRLPPPPEERDPAGPVGPVAGPAQLDPVDLLGRGEPGPLEVLRRRREQSGQLVEVDRVPRSPESDRHGAGPFPRRSVGPPGGRRRPDPNVTNRTSGPQPGARPPSARTADGH